MDANGNTFCVIIEHVYYWPDGSISFQGYREDNDEIWNGKLDKDGILDKINAH